MTPTSRSPDPPARAGILGGTFDPVHRGHIEVAEACAGRLHLAQVLLVPLSIPPHRPDTAAPAPDRLAMVELAVAGHRRLAASDIELRRGGVSYAIDTIRELRTRNPELALTLLLGWDAAMEFGTWKDARAIADLAQIAVFNRAGVPPPRPADLKRHRLPPATMILEIDSPSISASDLRRRLKQGEDVGDDLPDAVLEYIRSHGLYGSAVQ